MSAKDDLDQFEKTWPTFVATTCRYADELTAHAYSEETRSRLVTAITNAFGEFSRDERKRLRLLAREEAARTLAEIGEEAADG